MTPSFLGCHRVSQGFEWIRMHVFVTESDTGYRVLLTKQAGSWIYQAFGPEEKIHKDGDRVFFGELEYKWRYRRGEQVPPAYSYRSKSARRFLSLYRAKDFGSNEEALAAAKNACWQDWVNNNNGGLK